jgi:hypothetical protein
VLYVLTEIKNEEIVRITALHINEFPLKHKLYYFNDSDSSDGDILGCDTNYSGG